MLPLVIVELVEDEDTELLGVYVVDIVEDNEEPKLELDMLELIVDEVDKMLELALLDAMLELELLEVVPLPARSVVVALLLVVVDAELETRLGKLGVDDALLAGFVFVLCNEVVLLMMVEDEPAVEEVFMLPSIPELGGNIDVVLPSVLKVVDKLELDCTLELLLDAPLLDPVDGPETPVGVVHFDAGACAVRLVTEDL